MSCIWCLPISHLMRVSYCHRICREVLQKYKQDKAAGRFEHAKPAAPGSVPPEMQAFMVEVREFMRELKGQRQPGSASEDSVPSYEQQLAEQQRMRERIERMAEQDHDLNPDEGRSNATAGSPLQHCCCNNFLLAQQALPRRHHVPCIFKSAHHLCARHRLSALKEICLNHVECVCRPGNGNGSHTTP